VNTPDPYFENNRNKKSTNICSLKSIIETSRAKPFSISIPKIANHRQRKIIFRHTKLAEFYFSISSSYPSRMIFGYPCTSVELAHRTRWKKKVNTPPCNVVWRTQNHSAVARKTSLIELVFFAERRIYLYHKYSLSR
jgi:hypothetical protein